MSNNLYLFYLFLLQVSKEIKNYQIRELTSSFSNLMFLCLVQDIYVASERGDSWREPYTKAHILNCCYKLLPRTASLIWKET